MTRVLIVDDEIDTLDLLRMILELSGYQAVTTLNSVDAITLAELEHPDVILLDIMMPQLDGFTLCKMMRLHPSTAHLPIVFVTAYSALDLEDRRLDAGADMVLPKPIGMDVLIETVEKALVLRPRPRRHTGLLDPVRLESAAARPQTGRLDPEKLNPAPAKAPTDPLTRAGPREPAIPRPSADLPRSGGPNGAPTPPRPPDKPAAAPQAGQKPTPPFTTDISEAMPRSGTDRLDPARLRDEPPTRNPPQKGKPTP